jgi:hypothetical protein
VNEELAGIIDAIEAEITELRIARANRDVAVAITHLETGVLWLKKYLNGDQE